MPSHKLQKPFQNNKKQVTKQSKSVVSSNIQFGYWGDDEESIEGFHNLSLFDSDSSPKACDEDKD